MNGISRESIPNQSSLTGMGYITIPSDTDRTKYIQTCYRTERVSIQLDNGGGVIQNCYIDKEKLQLIEFPDDSTGLGSIVAFICDRFVRKPIIIGVLSDRKYSQLLEERSFHKVVNTASGSVSIKGVGKKGSLFINVESTEETGGSIFINLKSPNNQGKFKVNCFGNIDLYAEGETVLNTLKTINVKCSHIEGEKLKVSSSILLNQEGLVYEDSSLNKIEITEESVKIIPKSKLVVFSGNSPMVLGDELERQLDKAKKRIDDLITALQTATKLITTEAAFQTSLTAGLTAITDKESYDHINSTKSFID